MTLDSLLAFAGEHALLSLALLGLTLALVYTEVARLFSGFKSVNPAGLTALINREDALLVDLSASTDFEKGHIPGAKNVAPSQFDPESKLLAKVRDLPVVVTCRSGTASADAAKKLVKAGFKKVYWLDGGIGAWQQANLPLTKGR
ncbi:MAG: rhodanese-like domain-containing protein [Gammaproteobacteria bacterium]|jgi:rhodanese-related sulfurtransferase|nr:rhodanese-like domain-containing protein [Gammaproteobacteria bacterium]